MERVLKRLWVANKLLTIIHQTSVHPIESVDGFRASAYLRFVSFSPGLSIPEGCGGRLSLGHPVTLEILSSLLAWGIAERGRKEAACWKWMRHCWSQGWPAPPPPPGHLLGLLDLMPAGEWGRKRRAGRWTGDPVGGLRGLKEGMSDHRGGQPSSGQTALATLRLSDLCFLVASKGRCSEARF